MTWNKKSTSLPLTTICVILSLCLMVESAPHTTPKSIICDHGNPADVIFLLDASNSIWRPDFNRQIRFIKEITQMFRIGPSNTQVAVITYADYPLFQFHLNYYSSKSDILAAIDNIRQTGGYRTSTPEALKYMRERGFREASGGRANVTRVGIVITDGKSDNTVKTAAEAARAKDAGIHLFAVGVGMQLDLQELESIASPPSQYYTFMVESYSGLENIKELLAIKACTVTDPPTTTSTTAAPTTPTGRTGNGHGGRHPGTGSHNSIDDDERNSGKGTHGGRDGDVGGRDGDVGGRDGDVGGGDGDVDAEGRRKIHFASTPLSPSAAEHEPGFEIGEVKQRTGGRWVFDDQGNPQWISNRENEEGRDNKLPGGSGHGGSESDPRRTQGRDDPDYQVLPVDEPQRNGGSNHNDSHSDRSKHRRKEDETGDANEIKRHSGCKPKTPLDVVFVVDSKTRDKRSTRQLWDAVRNVVEQVDMDNGQMRVQFVQSCPSSDRLRHRPMAKSSPVDVFAPSRSTPDLFESMTSKLTSNGKPGRKRVGIYLTNGPSGDLEHTLEAVQEAKNVHGVEMFSVGLGKDVNPVELRAIASCEVPKHMFNAKHHSKSKEALKQLAKSLCSVR